MKSNVARGFVALVAVCVCLAAETVFAAGPTSAPAAASPQLGSLKWMPTPENPIGWRGDGTGRYPDADPPTVWARRHGGMQNIQWMSRLAAPSVATPIIVGEKIFLMSEPCDLVCLDKATGRILWMRPNHEAETTTDDDRKFSPDYAAKIDPLVPQLQLADNAIVAALNSNSAAQIAAVTKKKQLLDKMLVDALTAIDKKRYERYWGQGVFGFAGTTPTSDGKHVAVFCTTGVVAVYDLNGKRLWIDRGHGQASEHGNFASPLLIGGQLCVWAAEMRGYDVATGKLTFRNPGQTENTYGSMFRLRVGDDLVAAFQAGFFTRIRDGQAIWGQSVFGDAVSTPIVDNGFIYALVKSDLKSYKIPDTTDGKLEPQTTYKVDWGGDRLANAKSGQFDRSYTASPLLVDGLIYQMSEGGGLSVHDAATGTQYYAKQLDLKPHTEYWNWAGASASPTFAGKYIYLMDNLGTTIVIKPGKEYVEVSKNFLEDLDDNKSQAQNLATPIFEGSRMYYRTPDYLYCIGEK